MGTKARDPHSAYRRCTEQEFRPSRRTAGGKVDMEVTAR